MAKENGSKKPRNNKLKEVVRPMEEIKSHACVLADIIELTNTDYRGNLLLQTGKVLRARGQAYTGKVLTDAAKKYGYKEE